MSEPTHRVEQSGAHGHFVWYELMTTDTEAAKRFYSGVIGWRIQDASAPGMSYALFMADRASVGGLVALPQEARAMGVQPRWLGYVGVDDVGAAADRAQHGGGTVHVPPTDIPDIGRFAVITDPQRATLALIRPLNATEMPGDASDKPARVGWHELLAADWQTAFAFYSDLFNWRKAEAEIDSDDRMANAYLPFSAGGQTIGGMFTKPAVVPIPFWLYYVNVGDIDAAVAQVAAGGGEVLEGPVEVTGGSRVARCVDPQGAMFALIEKRKQNAPGYFARSATGAGARSRRWSW